MIISNISRKFKERPFRIGFIVGCILSMLVNILPFFNTRKAYLTDGVEVIGFPFVFRSLGGFTPIYQFSLPLLLADIVIIIIFSFITAYITKYIFFKVDTTKT